MKRPQQIFSRSRRLVGIALSVVLLQASPLFAAERIFVSFLFLERSIPVRDLERYAKEGESSSALAPYLGYFNPEQQTQLRASLQERLNLNTVAVAQFLYTPVGEALLNRVQQVVRTKSGQGSFHALRSALILAAKDPEGLTALSVLRNFPNPGIQVDLTKTLDLLNQIQQVVKTTNTAVAAVIQQSQAEPQADSLMGWFLSRSGPDTWEKITLEMKDESEKRLAYTQRAREIVTDIYFPTTASDQPYPVVVISHGFNSDRSTYAYLAQHLASHGYVVIMPEHSGSNGQQIADLFRGRAQDVIDRTEFLDRPLDVSYILDTLEQNSITDPRFQGRLDLKRVGMLGHSYGGYTALALAGATPNFAQLRQACSTGLDNTFNVSLVLQCQALQSSDPTVELVDSRIQGVIAISPIGSNLFGKSGYQNVKVPVMMMTGGADTIAPALPEQIQPFTWLTHAEKRLVLMNNGTHFSTGNTAVTSSNGLPGFGGARGPSALARYYVRALSTAFFGRYIQRQEAFDRFLTPSYAANLSQEPLTLHLTPALSLPPAPSPQES
ncbi:alpha/beta hydrolase [Acaryochloris sp. IP29b_bin.148]|uniref:alpha/beta hydrolase n=1 Tax=Acaryochloris sp. IP29b_bin.148 TaxID=2969218 RepID=UPI002612A024|nr:alpha/beta hydrolase [Acaryochloris sp. IP29b_bin.148]